MRKRIEGIRGYRVRQCRRQCCRRIIPGECVNKFANSNSSKRYVPDGEDEDVIIFDWNILMEYISKTKQSTAVTGSTFWKYDNRSRSFSPYFLQRRRACEIKGRNATCEDDHSKQGDHLKAMYWDAGYGG